MILAKTGSILLGFSLNAEQFCHCVSFFKMMKYEWTDTKVQKFNSNVFLNAVVLLLLDELFLLLHHSLGLGYISNEWGRMIPLVWNTCNYSFLT